MNGINELLKLDVDDNGKIWLRGSIKPEYGVRVGELYFITGIDDVNNNNYNILIKKNFIKDESHLFVDLHYPEKKYRILRRFAFDLEPKSPGTLFSGFTKTKHCDIKAITHRDKGVEEYIINEVDYDLKGYGTIDPIRLIELAGW